MSVYTYVSNNDPSDRTTQIQILKDDGTSAILVMGRSYDLSTTELARANGFGTFVAGGSASQPGTGITPAFLSEIAAALASSGLVGSTSSVATITRDGSGVITAATDATGTVDTIVRDGNGLASFHENGVARTITRNGAGQIVSVA